MKFRLQVASESINQSISQSMMPFPMINTPLAEAQCASEKRRVQPDLGVHRRPLSTLTRVTGGNKRKIDPFRCRQRTLPLKDG
jgi:hypothetical protein